MAKVTYQQAFEMMPPFLKARVGTEDQSVWDLVCVADEELCRYRTDAKNVIQTKENAEAVYRFIRHFPPHIYGE
jgi:hypothetical protein